MKILILTPRYYPEQFKINDIAKYLSLKHEVDVICNIPDYHKGKYYKGYSLFKNRKQKLDNINIYRLPTLPRHNNLISLGLSYLSLYFSGLFKANFVKKKYDIIINYQLSPVYIALIGNKIAKKQNIPSITYILDFWPNSLLATSKIKTNNFIYKYFLKKSKKAYLESSYIFVTSDGFINPLINMGYDKNKIFFIPNIGEDIFENKIMNKEFNIDISNINQKFKILFAGNVGRAQNFDLALNLAKLAKQNNYDNFVFLIVGNGSYLKTLKDNVIKNNVENYFVFYNEQPLINMPNFYNIADAFYFSLQDVDIVKMTIPGKLSSYMYYNKPIICDEYWKKSQIFIDYNGGVYLKNDKNDFDIVLDLINKYDYYLDRINKEFANQTFKKEIILNDIENHMMEILKNGK